MSSQHRADDDGFRARPSARVNQELEADNDTWQETLAVVEGPDGKLVVRSFYQSKQTGKREWDEPPSGATHIVPATDEMRKMANIQLTEMQVVTGAIDNNNKVPVSPNSSKKKGFSLNPFRRKKKDKKQDANTNRKIQYKAGSKFAAKKHPGHGEDAQLQEAIAMSLAESRGEEYVPGSASRNINDDDDDDDDEIAMAKALSMSEAEAKGISMANMDGKPSAAANSSTHHGQQESFGEDAMLQQALEASRAESQQKSGDLLGLEHDMDNVGLTGKGDPKVAPPSSKQAPTHASNSLKAPPVYDDSAPLTPKQDYGTAKAPLSPAQRFDPYSPLMPDQPKAKLEIPPLEGDGNGNDDSGSSLQKMKPDPPEGKGASSRLNFGRRSTKKIQDKAGLV